MEIEFVCTCNQYSECSSTWCRDACKSSVGKGSRTLIKNHSSIGTDRVVTLSNSITIDACNNRALKALKSLRTISTLTSLVALKALEALKALVSLKSLKALWTLIALVALKPLVALKALISLK